MPSSITWSAHSVSGSRKPANDDACLVFAAGAKKSTRLEHEGTHAIEDDDLVLAVSDGMGGGNAGDLASRLILTQLSQIIPKTIKQAAQGFHPDYLEMLENAIFEVHESINKHGEEDISLKGMAATITLTWITPENIYIAHVGDSRLYRCRNGETQQLTEDHNFVWKQFNRGKISELRYRMHPQRNLIHEVIGGGHKKLKPQTLSIPYTKGDRFMLCSDGIVDGLAERKIHAKLNQIEYSTNEVLDSLISAAVDNAGTDDTTCIVFDVTH